MEAMTITELRAVAVGLGRPLEAMTQAELVERAQGGESEAFDQLMKTHWEPLWWHCRRYLSNEEDIADLVQTTFLNAHRSIRAYVHRYSFGAWLKRIATNACIDLLRRRARTPAFVSADAQLVEPQGAEVTYADFRCEGEHPERAMMRAELSEAIKVAVAGLSPKLRDAITLREFAGLDYSEIAEALEISIGVVKSRIYYARQALMKELAPYYE